MLDTIIIEKAAYVETSLYKRANHRARVATSADYRYQIFA